MIEPAPADLPTLLIGGYLGAGKTTLVNHLLRYADGRRIAVLVNDFGAINIDADLIVGQDDDVLSLAGDCICCSFGADLVGTLNAVAQRQPRPDVLLIELSGVALPAAALSTARLARGVALNGTLVLVDAAEIQRLAADPYVGDTVLQQLQGADLLLINKADLADAAALAALPAWLQAQAPQAQQVQARAQQVAPELVLGWAAERAATSLDSSVNDIGPPGWAPRAISPHPAAARQVFASRSAVLPSGTDLQALGTALARPDSGVLRAKGLRRDAQGQTQLLQVVGARWQITPQPRRAANAQADAGLDPISHDGTLVLIGLRGIVDAADFSVPGLTLNPL